LAIYDSFRVDVFEGGRTGRIDLVRSFNPAVISFDVYLNRAVAYFEELWAEADTIDSLIERINAAIASARTRIDYASNWLARYEFALDPDDENLKSEEMKHAKDVLREEGRWGRIQSYLDIGTCTGRYPLLLREAILPRGTIVGIDEDFDCVRFAQSNVERQCPGDDRITIRQTDFSAPAIAIGGPFDLMTCMLGTLSHFGWDRRNDNRSTFDDALQAALSRMAKLLADQGLLLLSTWSQYACRNRAMLGIYRDSDHRRLASWTPEPSELQVRLRETGLKVVRHVSMLRLDLFVCGHTDYAGPISISSEAQPDPDHSRQDGDPKA
jgi:SAM-dependent methyltransferase